jgi:DNA integrity scanning protein DisA with diadenylate cyclase activity
MSYLYGLVLVAIVSAIITKSICLRLNLLLFKRAINKATTRCIKNITTKFDTISHIIESKDKDRKEIDLLYEDIKEDIELLFIDYIKAIEQY